MAIPGSRPNNRLILVIGIVCAALAFGGVLFILKGNGTQTRTVVVFKNDLLANTLITQDALTTADLPTNAVGADALTDPSQAVGKQVVNNVKAGTPVIPALLIAPGGANSAGGPSAGGAGTHLNLTNGYVAVAIPTALTYPQPGPTSAYELTGGNGDLLSTGFYIQPEDHIDVLIAFSTPAGPEVRYAFQDLRVLKVGDSGTAATAAAAVYVVEVPRFQAEVLAQLVSVTANPGDPTGNAKVGVIVKYVLRQRCDYGDTNYDTDVKALVKHTPAELKAMPASQSAPLYKQLKDACINPYPNYLDIQNSDPNFPNQPGQPKFPALPSEPGVTPQTMQGIFQIP